MYDLIAFLTRYTESLYGVIKQDRERERKIDTERERVSKREQDSEREQERGREVII